MDLRLPPHLLEPSRAVPKDDPPAHRAQMGARASSAVATMGWGVCGLRDWRRLPPAHAAHAASPRVAQSAAVLKRPASTTAG